MPLEDIVERELEEFIRTLGLKLRESIRNIDKCKPLIEIYCGNLRWIVDELVKCGEDIDCLKQLAIQVREMKNKNLI